MTYHQNKPNLMKVEKIGNRLYVRVPGVSGLKKDENVFVVLIRPEKVRIGRKGR